MIRGLHCCKHKFCWSVAIDDFALRMRGARWLINEDSDKENLQSGLPGWTPGNWRRPSPLAGLWSPSPCCQNMDEAEICLSKISCILKIFLVESRKCGGNSKEHVIHIIWPFRVWMRRRPAKWDFIFEASEICLKYQSRAFGFWRWWNVKCIAAKERVFLFFCNPHAHLLGLI